MSVSKPSSDLTLAENRGGVLITTLPHSIHKSSVGVRKYAGTYA